MPIDPYLKVALVLLFSVVGMGGSYWVAWYGIRVNTYANARTAFASLRGEPWDVVNIPLRAGMSIGLFLISLELVMMVIILLFVPRQIVGVCFLGLCHRRVAGRIGACASPAASSPRSPTSAPTLKLPYHLLLRPRVERFPSQNCSASTMTPEVPN